MAKRAKKASKKKAPVKKKAKKKKAKAEDAAPEAAPEVAPEVSAPAVPALDPEAQAKTHRERMGQAGPIQDRPKGAPEPSEVLKEYQTAKHFIFKMKNGGKIKIART